LLRPGHDARRAYTEAVCYEIRKRAEEVQDMGHTPNILYWGGGTASHLTEAEIEKIHTALSESFDLSAVTEATIEGSPDTVTPEKLRLIRSLGYNRFSFGVQSFDDERLRRLGRVHRADQARRATEWAAEAGFHDMNIDLMCGFPGEMLDEVERTIREGIQLPVTHVSFYPYHQVEGTVMQQQIAQGRGVIDVNEQKAAYALGRAILEDAGYPEYAMSYFGKPHIGVLVIFQLKQDWLGFGSGAISLINATFHSHERGRLAAYTTNPLKWDASIPAHSVQIALTLLNQGLSTFDGIGRDDWQQRTGQSLEQTLQQPTVKRYIDFLRSKIGLIESEKGIRLPKEHLAESFIEISHLMSNISV